jgi:hypothetical protein
MSERPEKEFERAGGIFALWAGFLVAPLAFLLNLQISYMLAPWACSTGHTSWLHVASFGSLLLALLGAFIAWRSWQKAGRGWRSDGGSAVARGRFMAIVGLMNGGLFSLIILAQWAADFIIGPCQP